MENSTNSSTEKILTIDYWLSQFAYVWPLNTIYLFVILPIGLIGFLLNLICFYILKHNDFNSARIYGYFRVITINSAMLCLAQASLFISLTHRYFQFSNTYEANYYSTVIYIPGSNVFLLYGSILDMCMSIERSSLFYIKFKVLVKPKPYKICFILFIISILIGLPYFFINCPVYYDAPLDGNTFYRLWFWEITPFGRSMAGQILTYANFFIRDVLFLLAELALNIFTIVLFRNYFRNKANLLGNRNKDQQNQLKSNNETNSSDTPNEIFQSSYRTNYNVQSVQLNNISIQEKNLTIMIIIMSFFSIIIHVFYLIVGILLNFSDSLITSSTGAFVVFTSILKHMSNLFFLFMFNVNFRKKFKNMFSIRFSNEISNKSDERNNLVMKI